MSNEKRNKAIDYVFVIIATLGFIFYCFELVLLHYNQTQYPITGMHESDLYAHIEMALDGWGYSILAVIFRLFSLLPTFAFNFAIAAFLCICEAATIAATYVFIKTRGVGLKLSILLSAVSAFVMPMYIRSIQPYRYIGYQSASIWHNSTYIVMKLCAFFCICLYLSISEKYSKEIKAGDLIVFAILLGVTTSVKTNFILVFAPVALLFLIIDLILGVPFKRIILCALTVVPSIAVILFQEIVLFGEDTGNGIIIDPLYSVYLRAEKPYFTMILSLAFPIFVLLINIVPVLKDTLADFKEKRKKLTHRAYLLSWAMWAVGFLEYILLRETGQRELDDNFAWGYDFCIFVLFVVSFIYFINNIKNSSKKVPAIIYMVIGGAMIIYHTYCGVYFFVHLCNGVTFFMQ